jgi:UbiD family decarboxylase
LLFLLKMKKMRNNGLSGIVKTLEEAGELKRIKNFVNPELELTEITDRISKQKGGERQFFLKILELIFRF